jgi:hypothetical protein
MKVLNLFTQLVGKVKTTDSQSGYRAYSRRAIEKIRVTNSDMGCGFRDINAVEKLQFEIGGYSDNREI